MKEHPPNLVGQCNRQFEKKKEKKERKTKNNPGTLLTFYSIAIFVKVENNQQSPVNLQGSHSTYLCLLPYILNYLMQQYLSVENEKGECGMLHREVSGDESTLFNSELTESHLDLRLQKFSQIKQKLFHNKLAELSKATYLE